MSTATKEQLLQAIEEAATATTLADAVKALAEAQIPRNHPQPDPRPQLQQPRSRRRRRRWPNRPRQRLRRSPPQPPRRLQLWRTRLGTPRPLRHRRPPIAPPPSRHSPQRLRPQRPTGRHTRPRQHPLGMDRPGRSPNPPKNFPRCPLPNLP
jgi:hypothetical protein